MHDHSDDPVGNLETLTYAHGIRHGWVYDGLNRLTELTVLDNQLSAIDRYNYTLRDSGHRSL